MYTNTGPFQAGSMIYHSSTFDLLFICVDVIKALWHY